MRDCCKEETNLKAKQERSDLVVKTCKICGAKHRELTVDPLKIGVKFQKTKQGWIANGHTALFLR